MNTFTTIHVLLSLIGIASGLVIVFGLILSKAMPRWTLLFIVTTLATSISGFFFPFHGFTPAIGLGIVSVVILLAVIAARYSFHMLKGWRWVFVIGTVAALYFNSFVLVVQAFLKIPNLHVLAPTGSGLPFSITQAAVLTFYVVAGALAIRGSQSAACG